MLHLRAGLADGLTYSGVGLFRPSCFASIAPGTKQALRPILEREIEAGKVGGEYHRGEWFDIGTVARLSELDLLLTQTGT